MKPHCSFVSLGEASASGQIDWKKCLFCQSDKGGEKLRCPNAAINNAGGAGYVTLAKDLLNFRKYAM